ncbi:tRNA pseudouridine(38-40) synthase TruA [Peptostreptococcus faecalis]|uniref:tRNA pseudouridine(38-40) synthase TruA n=1 Tax=Peptostreptococcus faecalis TaxID=2045015 RepID=UPI000C797BB5|nr:tRNA pseudouridine(38-40) synthase TruA [Peptostreptococcus faecalis]
MSERNIKLTIAYDGSRYKGWQRQPNSLEIQGEIEYACEQVFKKKRVEIIGSGRTDKGVHAIGQVANLKVETTIPIDKIPEALNNTLPDDIAILEAEEVDENFHARHSAIKKTYRYQVYPSRIKSPFFKNTSYRVKYRLDMEKMKKEIKSFEGEHDFAGFRNSGSSIINTVRTIYKIDIFEEGELIIIEVEGSGFLYNMVRIIVGTIIDIGSGRITEPLSDIIESKDRLRAGHTAPPQGLFLKEVKY